jgi:hypothetical protein
MQRKTIRANNSSSLLRLPDCIYLMENGTCRILTVDSCAGKNCSFLKTDTRTDTEKQLWRSRLSQLEQIKQQRIAKKYFGGKQP